MDYETKIYLEKLIEAVDSPDWWSIGITAVNALIVVGLTIWQLCLNRKQTKIQEHQNNLQQQQLKLQEKENKRQNYEHYYDIYCFVNSIYYVLNGVKQNILNNIFSGLPSDSNIKQLRKYKGTIERLRAQLYANEMEFNLKVKTEFDYYIYDDALECAEKIYNRIITELTRNTINIPDDISYFNGLATDEERFNALLNNQSEKEKETLEKYFGELKKYQDEILKSGVLETLEKHCKID